MEIEISVPAKKKSDDIGVYGPSDVELEERAISLRQTAAELKIDIAYLQEAAKLADTYAALTLHRVRPGIFALKLRKALGFPGCAVIVADKVTEVPTVEVLATKFGHGLTEGAAEASKHSEHILHSDGLPEAVITPIIDVIYLDEIRAMASTHKKQTYWRINRTAKVAGIYLEIKPAVLLNSYINSISMISSWLTGRYDEAFLSNHVLWPLIWTFFESNLRDLPNVRLESTLTSLYVLWQNEKLAGLICDIISSLYEYLQVRLTRWGDMITLIYLNAPADINSIVGGAAAAKSTKKLPAVSKSTKTTRETSHARTSMIYNILSDVIRKTVEPVGISDIVLSTKPSLAVTKIITSLDKFSPWIDGQFSIAAGEMAAIMDVMATHLITEWMKIITGQSVDAELSERKNRVENYRRVAVARLPEETAVITELTYRWLYICKFGFGAYSELRGPNRRNTREDVMSLLYLDKWRIMDALNHDKPKEAKLLGLEYDKMMAAKAADALEPPPWLPIVRALRRATGIDEKRKLFQELAKYLPFERRTKHDGVADDYIRDEDGRPIICPHVRDQIRLSIEGRTEKQMHDFLIKYAGDVPLHDAFYCKICGEVLTYDEQMDGVATNEESHQVAGYHNESEGLRDFLWRQASQLVRGQIQFLQSSSNEYINRFIRTIVNALYDVTALAEKKIYRIKTINQDERNDRIRLFAAIYIWAYLIRTVSNNPKLLRFTFAPKASTAKALLPISITKFSDIHNVLISRLRDVNNNFIHESLYKAFTAVGALTSSPDMKPVESIKNSDIEKLDPVKLYLARGATPDVRDSQGKAGTNGKSTYSVWDITGDLVADLNEYREDSFKQFVNYVDSLNKPGADSVFDTAAIAAAVTAADVPLSKFYADIQHELKRLHELDAIFSPISLKMRGYAVSQIPKRKRTGFFEGAVSNQYRILSKYSAALIGRFYGKDINPKPLPQVAKDAEAAVSKSTGVAKFHKHKWNIFIYDDGPVPVDRACSICLYTITDVGKFDAKTVAEWLAEEQELTNFFNYYQNRCPSADDTDPFHDFPSDAACKKCAVTKSMLASRDQSYFAKFKKQYDEATKLSEKGHQISRMVKQEPLKLPPNEEVSALITKSPSAINQLVTATQTFLPTFGLKLIEYRNLWGNMGASEGRDFDDILNGKIGKASSSSVAIADDVRANRLRSYMLELLFDYNTLVNHANIGAIPFDIKQIVDAAPPPKSSTSLDLQLAAPWLDNLAGGIMMAHGRLGKATGDMFVSYFINKLINSERIMSKMKERKKAAAEAAQRDDLSYNPNMQDHSQSNSFDGLPGEEENKYGYEGMDYNGENELMNT